MGMLGEKWGRGTTSGSHVRLIVAKLKAGALRDEHYTYTHTRTQANSCERLEKPRCTSPSYLPPLYPLTYVRVCACVRACTSKHAGHLFTNVLSSESLLGFFFFFLFTGEYQNTQTPQYREILYGNLAAVYFDKHFI